MLRILHLEDDEMDRDLIQLALSQQGIKCEVFWVPNRERFRQLLDEVPIDLILCDSSGPGFDGKQELEHVHKCQPDTVFVFVTGHHPGKAIEALEKAGADGVIHKGRLGDMGRIVCQAFEKRGRHHMDLPWRRYK